jgi:peroxiredoxin
MLGSIPVLFLAAVFAPPQDPAGRERTEAEWLEGHSHLGEAFDEGPRQKAYLMEKPSSVHFPITSTVPLAQDFFDQGVGQLHGFWYFEAERSFRQVAALDPTCAMAYWGMAMANVENETRAIGFARESWNRRESASDRERLYVLALAHFLCADSEPPPAAAVTEAKGKEAKKPSARKEPTEAEKAALADRAKEYVKALEKIIYEYPDDIEAKAFLVNQLWYDERYGLDIVSRQANQALLDQIFAAQPMHPAHHYRIHLWDDDDTAARVVDSAALCGSTWPSCAHMWHMSGHIWEDLGRNADAAWQQEASARVDHAHMMRDGVLPDQIHNFAHNNEWLVRSMRHCGRVREAIELAKNMIELPRHPKYNTLDKPSCSASYGRRRLLETIELHELWSEAIDLASSPYLEPCENVELEELRLFVLAEARAWRGDEPGLAEEVEALEALLARERAKRVDSAEEAEREALAAKKSEDEVHEAMKVAMRSHADSLRSLERSITGLRALGTALRGECDDATLEAVSATRIPREHLARLYLERGKTEAAEKVAREQAGKAKGISSTLAMEAFVLESAGKHDEAKTVFEDLRSISSRFDLELPAFRRLLPLAQTLGYPEDWRIEEHAPADVGERIDLALLGPKRWSPSPAPAFELAGADGKKQALSDHAGRPVIVIFFLGFGCVHCVEQLAVFEPEVADFSAAGIDILAIGTDAKERTDAAAPARDGGEYTFPILWDADRSVFRRYRAYDDFEDMPLHGTFLVDGAGLVRWQDISFEPFRDVGFLLAEAKRLLALPVTGAASGGAAVSSGASGGAR